ncbi:MAG: hypothetical protein KKH41_07010 [Candidatus Thermoplasmatota archaeon]|nr:hypothetical protein [Euryarchaeota archaeon]MBU4031731.1 hypothetical protein [Candidatus Thermoplasmatota archaeon]MBU4144452.1 hypothetical protein [Candidatus Thermoplasmatota archaeon]MBU4592316.1 hypothetical protein [Candidatus Thermoplasmatota archaeon]
MKFIEQHQRWYCHACKQYAPKAATGQPAAPQQPIAPVAPQQQVNPLWTQNVYRIRKKVLTLWNKYWIEDQQGKILGFSKMKMFKLKEDIRIYTDENMTTELFAIKQQQILDIWGTFAVVDTQDNKIGYIKRKALASTFVRDEYEVYDAYNRLIGGIYEDTGRGLVRKYVPLGGLVPQHMDLTLNGQKIATINQEFKIIGDIWQLNCIAVPPYLDRRVLLACLLMMGMIERSRK